MKKSYVILYKENGELKEETFEAEDKRMACLLASVYGITPIRIEETHLA